MLVYLNGSFLDHGKAAVPVDDRGFLFADGVYEVIRVYRGQPFLMPQHLQRLRQGLDALRIDHSGIPDLDDIATRLIADNDVTGDGTIYVQVTRGVAPRKHAFPAGNVAPTVYAFAKPFRNHPPEYFADGVAAITVADTRWSRCDIKAIALLPNVLANQTAHEAGAFEALFVRDGVLIEGSHSNLFGVVDGVLMTYPSTNYILTGITRNLVLELARELDIPAVEGPIYQEQRPRISELFLSGTTTEIMPVTRLDGGNVGTGMRGEITEQLQRAFRARIERMTGGVASAA
jgi:D-alanine transaminase